MKENIGAVGCGIHYFFCKNITDLIIYKLANPEARVLKNPCSRAQTSMLAPRSKCRMRLLS
jgi:hypothetical protein